MKASDIKAAADPVQKEIRKLKGQLTDTKRKLSQEKDQHALTLVELQDVRTVAGLLETLEQATAVEFKIKPTGAPAEATAVAQLSDLHAEEKVDPKGVNNINRYSPKIASQRLERFAAKLVRMVEHERALTAIDHLVLHFGGDLMSGYIHEELEESNAMTPPETVVWLYEHLSGLLDFLLDAGGFDNVHVVCSVGNHGRTTKKRRVSTEIKNSYEYLLYRILQSKYADTPGITFSVSESYHAWVNIYKFPCRFHHGHNIRYQGGVGGITIPVNKAIAQWDKIRRAYLDFFGHYHQSINTSKFCSNGSVIGYNAFALSIKAEPEPPQQRVSIIDRDRGLTKSFPIFLD